MKTVVTEITIYIWTTYGQVRELNRHRGEKKIFDWKDQKKAQ